LAFFVTSEFRGGKAVTLSKQFTLGISLVALCFVPLGASGAGANATADSYVSAGSPASNFGASAGMNIGGGNSALIQFDLSALPLLTAAQVSKATMSFYVNTAATTGGVDVSQVTSAWTEAAVTFNSRPTFLSPFATNVQASAAKQWIKVDVTQLVRDWVSGTAANFGLQVSAAAASSTLLVLDSRENATTSHPAFLDIVIQSLGPAGPAGATGPSGAAGSTGPAGPAGPTGPAGANNTTSGPTGPTGAAGATGAQGAPGTNGTNGAAGVNAGFRLTGTAINPGTTSPWYHSLNGELKLSTQNPEWVGGASPLACNITKVTLTLFTIAGSAGATTMSATVTRNGVQQSAGIPTLSVASAATGGHTTGSQTGSIAVAVGDVLNMAFTQTSGSPVIRYGVALLCN
jgi:hypothetical protein